MKLYAGIGSRDTPEEYRRFMTFIAFMLRSWGWTLRSGGAKGADTAFAKGAGSLAEIYHPKTHEIPPEAYRIAEEHHPAWEACSSHARDLLARNVCILLGLDLRTSVQFVIYWRPQEIQRGGTLHALGVANAHQIPTQIVDKPFDIRELVRYVTPVA